MTAKQHRFGVLTPSSNTALEPLTCGMLAELPDTSAHFSRFRVTRIALDDQANAQFDLSNLIAAAELLGDAKVDVIGWSGTSASWLGFDHDEQLCEQITQATGIPATTSILALNEALETYQIDRFGLVTPYMDDVQVKILNNYAKAGRVISAESHLSIQDNFSFAEVSEVQLHEQVRSVAAQGVPAIVLACTNLNSAHLVPQWEAEYGIPVFDTTTTVVWKMLQMRGQQAAIRGWGRLLAGEF